jgi:long-subunit acyl-CoA synthetase (AMP-forming)
LPGALSFDELAKLGAEVSEVALAEAACQVSGADVAMIQFTSGTTALPKGAMLFQAACCAALNAAVRH